MDEWENPNPIMLSERVAQRSAEEHQAAHRAKSQCAGGTPCCTVQQVPARIVWAGSARQDTLGQLPRHRIKVPA